jgi:hypothetical protein
MFVAFTVGGSWYGRIPACGPPLLIGMLERQHNGDVAIFNWWSGVFPQWVV